MAFENYSIMILIILFVPFYLAWLLRLIIPIKYSIALKIESIITIATICIFFIFNLFLENLMKVDDLSFGLIASCILLWLFIHATIFYYMKRNNKAISFFESFSTSVTLAAIGVLFPFFLIYLIGYNY